MDGPDRARLREALEAAEALVPGAREVHAHRAATHAAAAEAASVLRARLADLHLPGMPHLQAVPLGTGDDDRLGHLTAAATLLPLSADQDALLRDLAEQVPRDIASARRLGLLRSLFLGRRGREDAEGAARRLIAGNARWGDDITAQLLGQLRGQTREPALPVPVEQIFGGRVALGDHLRLISPSGDLVPVSDLAGLPAAVGLLAGLITDEQRARQRVLDAAEAVRSAEATRLLEGMPLDRLREATRERLRVGALTEAGLRTVQDVLTWGERIRAIPGVGEVTGLRMLGAAASLHRMAREDAKVELDPHRRSGEGAELLAALHTWEVVRQGAKATDVVGMAQALQPLTSRIGPATTHVAVVGPGSPGQLLREVAGPLLERAAELRGSLDEAGRADPWDDFVARPTDYLALLSELGLIEETGVAGDLPEDLIEAVRAQELDATHLTVSLRGYQSFAARFALVQRKVLLGDEMGLGKTIEALAVLAHLAAEGSRWFLVVCPAAVVSNWVREIDRRTTLPSRRLHGALREEALEAWRREGGVAVTTYSTLRTLGEGLAGFELDALVVDEAHYVKNPWAKRSQSVAALARRTGQVVLLTGTPLENRTGEFAVLVDYLDPELIAGRELGPAEFRSAVAPVYLRRNTEDVLVELPDLVEVEEWIELSAADEQAYRDAVAEGNFMAMRRAAFVAGIGTGTGTGTGTGDIGEGPGSVVGSAKLERLVEIVQEAEENGRRVLVFSYFRDVLDRVVEALRAADDSPIFGPLTGSVPAAERQLVVDEFSAAPHGAALVAQIQAGGVGLNIQAASVVVICEPQLKPTTEWQAIARARRMGQLESVQVHRLLAEDSVDERLVELLAGKTEIFGRYARVSETAQAAPEAYDISEADLARQVIEAERQRLFPGDTVTEAERRRLSPEGAPAEPPSPSSA
ncbi:DEAD/DEAH box helicase [Ornithinimicrobium panacihumi]|uniref:DEAD/DEAH box helicase n=1 Tax=Ornithinimicrobium panacihumi TaxID=2008449 RepID=UPI003F8A624B